MLLKPGQFPIITCRDGRRTIIRHRLFRALRNYFSRNQFAMHSSAGEISQSKFRSWYCPCTTVLFFVFLGSFLQKISSKARQIEHYPQCKEATIEAKGQTLLHKTDNKKYNSQTENARWRSFFEINHQYLLLYRAKFSFQSLASNFSLSQISIFLQNKFLYPTHQVSKKTLPKNAKRSYARFSSFAR